MRGQIIHRYPVVSVAGLVDCCQKNIRRCEAMASKTNSFARMISALLILQPSLVLAAEIQLQLHAGFDFTDHGESTIL